MHHFAFLFWLPTHNFSSPITCFLPLKSHFLTTISLFANIYLMVREGFIYTAAANIYAFRPAFSSILHYVLHHFTLHLAPKRTAFCTKTHCILHQNALRLAAYCTAFSTKTHYILLKMAPKRVFVAVSLNKNSFCRIHMLPPFCIKTNLRENRFFAAKVGNRLRKRVVIMLKFELKIWHVLVGEFMG